MAEETIRVEYCEKDVFIFFLHVFQRVGRGANLCVSIYGVCVYDSVSDHLAICTLWIRWKCIFLFITGQEA